jgi:hypothetical protein
MPYLNGLRGAAYWKRYSGLFEISSVIRCVKLCDRAKSLLNGCNKYTVDIIKSAFFFIFSSQKSTIWPRLLLHHTTICMCARSISFPEPAILGPRASCSFSRIAGSGNEIGALRSLYPAWPRPIYHKPRYWLRGTAQKWLNLE